MKTVIVSGALSAVCYIFLGHVAAAGEPVDLLCDHEGAWTLNRWQAYHAQPVPTIGDVWRLADGVLTCKGLPRGYLYTKQKYTDFVLELQWRWPPGAKAGNGGVLFRMTGPHKVWPKCLEAQLNRGNEGDFVGIDGFCFNGPADRLRIVRHPQFGEIRFLARRQAAVKPPGQWNDLKITAKGGTVTLRLNGTLVNQASRCDVAAGPILLTAENDPIQFRRIRITTLRPEQ